MTMEYSILINSVVDSCSRVRSKILYKDVIKRNIQHEPASQFNILFRLSRIPDDKKAFCRYSGFFGPGDGVFNLLYGNSFS